MSGAPTASSDTFNDTRTPEEHVADFIKNAQANGTSHERMIADMLTTYKGRWQHASDIGAALEGVNKLLRNSLEASADFRTQQDLENKERYKTLLDDIRALVPRTVQSLAELAGSAVSDANDTLFKHGRLPSDFRCVIMESPYKNADESEHKLNILYARACMKDCLTRFEAPAASHLLYTQVLDDNDAIDRDIGIKAGLAWGRVAEATVVYTDRGISQGMRYGIENARKAGRPIEHRTISGWI